LFWVLLLGWEPAFLRKRFGAIGPVIVIRIIANALMFLLLNLKVVGMRGFLQRALL